MSRPDEDSLADVARLVPLLREVNHLKRIRVAGKPGSMAERLFRRAWSRLVNGEDATRVALEETSRAVCATLLAGIEDDVLAAGEVSADARLEIARRAFDSAAHAIEPGFAERLRDTLATRDLTGPARDQVLPRFVSRLAGQPRAGATRPCYPRVVLEPAENHAEHCAVVAVNGVLAAGCFGADAGRVFLTGLAHHLHNAQLPDAGDAGDKLLGVWLLSVMETFRNASLSELSEELCRSVCESLELVFRADSAEAKAFQAADSLDRVLEMDWHARSAGFTLAVALEEMDIIHPGPVQLFQLQLMQAVGWKH